MGFDDELLPLSAFSDPTNGYLIDDSCAFGAEIYVIKPNNATFESVDLSKTTESPIFTWKIKDYSNSEMTSELCSPEFIIGGWKWILELYPNGLGTEVGKSISCYLCFIDIESLGGSELETKFKLRIIDQVSRGSKEHEFNTKFCSSDLSAIKDWGIEGFLSLKDLKDATKNYLLDNTLLIEVEICGLSNVKETKISDVAMD